MMGRSCCYIFLSSVMKFLNFLQTFTGLSMILYSVYMLNIWNDQIPSPSPAPEFYHASDHLNLSADFVFNDGPGLGLGFGLGFGLDPFDLPAPWFIYAFMAMGILLCFINFLGQVAADFRSQCCLCVYSLFASLVMALEGALVSFIAFDNQWEADIPLDPTGQLDFVRAFIEENLDLCKWGGIVALTVQALSLLIAIILRAILCASYASEGDYDVESGKTWKTLLNPPPSQKIWSHKGDGSIWSSLMREKYGLNSGDHKQTLLNQTPSINAKPKQ